MAQPLALPYSYFADANGIPLAGGKIYTYIAGTTTPQNSYTDASGLTPASNPVILDSAGRATIWLNGNYKIIVKDALNNLIMTTDGITAATSTGNMSTSIYDPSNIQEQVVGLASVQTLSNKTLVNPSIVGDIGRGGLVNRFINGTMDVAQAAQSGTVASGTSSYTLDRWRVGATGATVSWSQTENHSNGTYYELLLTGASGMTDTYVAQRIEGIHAQIFDSQQVTVQFWVYNNTGSSITPLLTILHATAVDNWTGTVTDVGGVTLQSCPNGTAAIVAYTFNASASSHNGIDVLLDFGSALNSGAKQIAVLSADIRITPGLPVGINSSPPPMELRPFAEELALCQRYYETSYDPRVMPGTVTANGQEIMIASTTTGNFNIRFKNTKRTTPTIQIYSTGTGTAAKVYDQNSSSDVSVASTPGTGTKATGVQFTSTAAHQYTCHWVASCEL